MASNPWDVVSVRPVRQPAAKWDVVSVKAPSVPGSKDYAPGVAKPDLPSDDIGPHGRRMPKVEFPRFTEEFQAYPDQSGNVANLFDGAAQMTRKTGQHARNTVISHRGMNPDIIDFSAIQHPHETDESPKLGGASKMFRGATGIAAPAAVSALPFAMAAAPVATLAGVAGGYGGGWLGREGAKALDANEDTQNFMEDAGSLIGGAGTGIAAESPKIQSFVKGAASEFPNRMVKMGIGGYGAHAMGIPPSVIAAGEAAYALPSMYRAGAAASRGKPWLGPGALQLFSVPERRPVTPGPVRQAMADARGRMESMAGHPQIFPSDISIPPAPGTFRKPGGIHNIPQPVEQAPITPGPVRQAMADARARMHPESSIVEIPDFKPIAPAPGTFRKPGGIHNQIAAENPTPAQKIAADAKSHANIKAFREAKEAANPVKAEATLPAPNVPIQRETGMAANLQARDAGLPPQPSVSVPTAIDVPPVSGHPFDAAAIDQYGAPFKDLKGPQQQSIIVAASKLSAEEKAALGIPSSGAIDPPSRTKGVKFDKVTNQRK